MPNQGATRGGVAIGVRRWIMLASNRRAGSLDPASMSEYLVIYEQAPDGGCATHIPDLPGVGAGQVAG